MALLFFTGFENEDGYEGDYCSSTLIQSATQKRTGNYAGFTSGNDAYLIYYTVGSEVTYVLGAAFYIPSNGQYFGCSFYESTDLVTAQFSLQIYALTLGGVVYVKRGAYNGTELAAGSIPIYPTTWYYVEVKVTVNNTTGSVIVNVNDVEDINISGKDTQGATSDSVGAISLGYVAANANHRAYVDDFYICDTTGSVNNNFLGPVSVEGLQPSGNGYNSDFVGSDADSTDNYLHVDEVPADGDTSYVKSSTPTDIDAFALDNLTSSISSIKGVKVNSVAKVSDTFVRNYKNLIRVSGTNYLGSDNTPDASYNNDFDIWEEDPNTATGWTETGVNGIEIGVTVTS